MKKYYLISILLFSLNSFSESWMTSKYNFSIGENVLVRVDDKEIGSSLALGDLAGGNIYMKGIIQEIIPVMGKSGVKTEILVETNVKVNLDHGEIVTDIIDDIVPIRTTESGRKFFYQESVLVSKKDSNEISIYLEGNFLGLDEDNKLKIKFPGKQNYELISKEEIFPFDTINEINVPECERKDILYFWNEPYNMPQYHQGPDGICYAYAGIQLIDMYRAIYQDGIRGKKIELSNAVMAGLLSRVYQIKFQKKFAKLDSLAGGFTTDVIEALKYYGMCSSEEINNSLAKFFKDKGAISSKKFYYLTLYFITYDGPGGLKNKIQAKAQFKEFITKEEAEQAASKTFKSTKVSKNYKWLTEMEKDVELEAIANALIPYLMNEDYVGFLQDVFSDCLKEDSKKEFYKSIPPTRHCELSNIRDQKKVYEIITGELDRPRIKIASEDPSQFPLVGISKNDSGSSGIAISYCSNVVRNRNFRGLNKNRTYFSNEKCGNHASIIVGKRARGGRCQFLVRNTAGNNCGYDWECEKNIQGKEEGFWIDAEALVDNIYKLDYFIPATAIESKHPVCPLYKMK